MPKGKVPTVGKKERSRTKKGNWRKKRSDAGKKRGKLSHLVSLYREST